MNVNGAKSYMLEALRTGLSDTLYYHSLDHVLDVLEAVVHIAKAEGIHDQETLDLLRTAALFHDAGFMHTYQGHEEEGCRIAEEALPQFGYSPAQITAICGMIRATRVPQSPATKLEEILCDADLDYLGRHDFETIAHRLYRELEERNMVENKKAWNQIQIDFMEKHRYWSSTEQQLRQPVKEAHLCRLREVVREEVD